MIFVIRGLYELIKEIFKGSGKKELEQLETPKDKAQYKEENPSLNDKINQSIVKHKDLLLESLMRSRKKLAFILLLLIVSIFVNVRLLQIGDFTNLTSKPSRVPTPNRDDRTVEVGESKEKTEKDKATVPLVSAEQQQRAYIDIMMNLRKTDGDK